MRPDPLGEIRRLLEARKKAYESADHVIEAELLSVEEVISKVSSLALGTR
jgi:shikimate kinase